MPTLNKETFEGYIEKCRTLPYPALEVKFVRLGNETIIVGKVDYAHSDLVDETENAEPPKDGGLILIDLSTSPRVIISGNSTSLEIGNDPAERDVTVLLLVQLVQLIASDEFPLSLRS